MSVDPDNEDRVVEDLRSVPDYQVLDREGFDRAVERSLGRRGPVFRWPLADPATRSLHLLRHGSLSGLYRRSLGDTIAELIHVGLERAAGLPLGRLDRLLGQPSKLLLSGHVVKEGGPLQPLLPQLRGCRVLESDQNVSRRAREQTLDDEDCVGLLVRLVYDQPVHPQQRLGLVPLDRRLVPLVQPQLVRLQVSRDLAPTLRRDV
mmetsp:Transcript_15221/g.51309  ORF Transcript_15221/g.51309 Transcript_15221/m.51309 type:complete len:205 (-) Transcript_15221:168-782(-)